MYARKKSLRVRALIVPTIEMLIVLKPCPFLLEYLDLEMIAFVGVVDFKFRANY